MSEKGKEKTDEGQQAEMNDPVFLANALRFEQAKNKVLLDEVVALEDEMVNRCMADFDAVVSDETREFWREQLLSNRDAATRALQEVARAQGSGEREDGSAGTPRPTSEGSGRRPLHNRAVARPLLRQGYVGQAAAAETDERAAKIRNRAGEIAKTERVPFSVAFRRAEKELGGK